MAKNIEKYLHPTMDKVAGLEHTFHRTKIVATVGPACDTYEKLCELVKAGVNVFRLNFSHGKHEDHAATVARVRRIATELGRYIPIIGDIQGPKLRIGDVEGVPRDARTAFAVAQPTARFAGGFGVDAAKLRVSLPVEAASPGRYEARGTLYATAKAASMRPVSQAQP